MRDVVKKTDFEFKQGEIVDFARAAKEAADYVGETNFFWLKIETGSDKITVTWCVQE